MAAAARPAGRHRLGWLAGLGIVHTGLAYVVLYAGMAKLSASRIALLQFVYLAAEVLLDWTVYVVYGCALSALQPAGAVLMGGTLLAARRQSPL